MYSIRYKVENKDKITWKAKASISNSVANKVFDGVDGHFEPMSFDDAPAINVYIIDGEHGGNVGLNNELNVILYKGDIITPNN